MEDDSNNDNHSLSERDYGIRVNEITHHLTASLMGIRGTTEVLIREFEVWDDVRKLATLEKILFMTKHSIRTVRNIAWQTRHYSDTELETYKRWVDFKSFLFSCIKGIESFSSARGITVIVENTPSSLMIFIHPMFFEMAILNLLDNAIRYAKVGSKIFIRVSMNISDLSISITDYGIPIGKEDAENLFIDGYRSKAAMAIGGFGLGIGLSVTKSIIQFHKGNISFQSFDSDALEDVHKVTFDIQLPLSIVKL